jgi:AcrR family transcriptional regulator
MKRGARAGGRRRPSQRRSQVTVTAILDAAARVFEERGFEAGTTNFVAERAGVSIGSLYEYFPNKDAMVVALVELHAKRPALHRILDDQAEHPPAAHACVLRFEESLAHALAHRYALRGIHDLARAAFVREVTRLLVGYASARGARPRSARRAAPR